ncbi:uncharacterized protein AB675_9819 [Cyphellophora attinorum]|uniref:Uncharacterized protein n=1 Tax=Cyphellophora attinorum TaxID=1664694 RepID=A0A0N1HWZ6_9EURO|nr:uncharacterized protein AB675_9819 [Phialophora attinorum]KPI42332.1 hypothetical protein AB675_9819 [Phialophora attinorum]
MPQHVTHAEVVNSPQFVTYANVVANKPVFASRHLLRTVNQEKSETNPTVPTIVITEPCRFQNHPLRKFAKLPIEILIQILELLLPKKIQVHLYGERSWTGPRRPRVLFSWMVNNSHSNDMKPQLTRLLLIRKDLSALLGPMIFSRIEVMVKGLADGDRWWYDDRLFRRDRIAVIGKVWLQPVYDVGLSHLHQALVEKYDRSRVWVDGTDRDRELGLFGAARAKRARAQAKKDEEAREAKAKRLWSDVVKGARSEP